MSVKEIGCGGRDSRYVFVPCRLCPNKTEKECNAICRLFGLIKHEEYFTSPEKTIRYTFSGRAEMM